jgi:hypothetical protein
MAAGTTQPYQVVYDPATGEISDLDSHSGWMAATIIEDDDLMFGGKPLSAWYEEDRRQSMGSEADEERTRGRQRERPRSDASHHGHHHHHHHHHHKHGKSKKESKQ